MFTPPDAMYAARKVALVQKACEGAGYPISSDTSRRIVARSWGWSDWGDVRDGLNRGYEPSPLDEELVGNVDFLWARDEARALVVARRRADVATAFAAVTGLPMNVADDFAAAIRLTDDHARRSDPARDREIPWLSPGAFEEKVRLGLEPLPDCLVELARSLAYAAGTTPSAYPPLPPHRPRR